MRRIVACVKAGIVAASCIAALFHSGVAYAEEKPITAQVCQPGATAAIAIVAPVSDTVVREQALELTGSARLINQVELYVDDAYSGIVALPRGEEAFEFTVTLRAGTQTLEARGNNICTGETMTDRVVVTYEAPPTPETPTDPTEGPEVPTVINPNPTPQPGGGGVVVSNPNPTDPDATPKPSDGSWLSRLLHRLGIPGFFDWVIRVTDTDVTLERAGSDGLRAAVFTLGALMLVGARQIVGWLAKHVGGWFVGFAKRKGTVWMRMIGVLLLLISMVLWL